MLLTSSWGHAREREGFNSTLGEASGERGQRVPKMGFVYTSLCKMDPILEPNGPPKASQMAPQHKNPIYSPTPVRAADCTVIAQYTQKNTFSSIDTVPGLSYAPTDFISYDDPKNIWTIK